MSYQRSFIAAVLPAETISGQASMDQVKERGHQPPLWLSWVHLLRRVTRPSEVPKGIEDRLRHLGRSAASQDRGSDSGVRAFRDVEC